MPVVNWGAFVPEDHRANRLHDVQYYRAADPSDPTRFLYSNGPRMVLEQLELFEPLQVQRAPAGAAGGQYRYRITMPDGYPPGLRETVDVLKQVLTLSYVAHVDVALALDWYKKVEDGVDSMNWQNTRAGELNNISKYRQNVSEVRQARSELLKILCGVIQEHRVLASCEVVMSTPGSRGDGNSHGEQLAEAVAKRAAKRLIKPTSRGARPERKAGGEPAEDIQVDLLDTFAGERVLVIDDVFRTGATMRATALAARRAGAGLVTGLVIARTLRS